ncbi:helix-turn-helix domain-containing protein [Yinghuangia soli]|uniref:Helix-turn-helix domain-containing protein n=1 Tax=Yinghuangia soli TaxID=2908204 RepID=A0AA41Q196_9ACTN|nr:helix-turn-helix domain-containing protein [Yinghuangia soli]MCF2529705.1 helix-turn-helix domain-containing protein [Yinghuangia soli]
MFSLRDLSAIPEFGIGTGAGAEREVHSAVILSGSQWIGPSVEKALVVSDIPSIGVVDRLVRTLAAGRAAGLVIAGAPHEAALGEAREAAARYRFPVLTSTRPLSAWKSGLAQSVMDLSVARTRRHAARLGRLLEQLRAPSDTVGGISGLLADELDAEVVVRGDNGIMAACPAAAPLTLASVIQRPDRPHQTTPTGLFARTVPLSQHEVLIVATKEPQGRADAEVVDHAAAALSYALAPRSRDAGEHVAAAVRGIRLSAFQMLMTGHAVHARRVMAGLAPGLLDSESARVFIVDCARADRDTVMAEVERSLGDRALAVRCPAYHEHVIVVAPEHGSHDGHGGHDAERELRRLRETFSIANVAVGGSLAHPIEGIGSAYGEAADALARASHHPERTVITSSRTPSLVDVLPAGPSYAWASRFLHPILSLPRQGAQILEATAMALEFRTSAAARIIGVHRNTVARRVTQVCGAVGLDPERTLDRITLSLAIQIVTAHPSGPADLPEASLHDILTHPRVRTWADKAIRPLADDRRDLVRTLRAWVDAEFNAGAAAAELGVATKTVRSHIRAAEALLERDLITGMPQDVAEDADEQRLSGLRPLTVALYATTSPGARLPALLRDPTGFPADPPGTGLAELTELRH